MRRKQPTSDDLIDSIIVGHSKEDDNNKEKIYVNTIQINDLVIKLVLLILILSALFNFVFYMYVTVNEHRDFMNKTTETLYAFSPDSRVLNWVLKPQSSPDNIIPSLLSEITATIMCTPPRASPSVSPVIKNVVNSLLQGYECPYKDIQDIPTECYANAFYQDPTTNDINPCFASSEIESFCLIAILKGLDNGIITLDRDGVDIYASRFDQTIRFVQPNPRPTGMEYDSLCPLRSIEELVDNKIYLSKGPPYSIDIDQLSKYGHEDMGDNVLPPSSIPLLGTTVSSASMHMSTVPFVQEMAGVEFYVYDNEIVEVEFYVNIGNVVYRPDLFYDTNDAWSLSFRSIPTSYTIYPVCRKQNSPVGNDNLQCKIATQFHAEYSFSQENDLDLTDPNVYNNYTIPKVSDQTGGKVPFTDYVWRNNRYIDNGYYNRFTSTRRIKTIFQTRGTGDNYLIECHPVLVWDIPDLTVPTPPSILDRDFFTCTSHAGVLTSYPAGIIDMSMNINNTCAAYIDNLSLCKENKMFPGVEHCARKINNAGLFSMHTDTIVTLVATANPRIISVQFKEASDYNTINSTYIKNSSGVLQTWCNINPLTNFTTPGWSNNSYSQNTSCCTKQTSYLFGGDSFEQPESFNLCNIGSSTPTPSFTRTPTRSPTRTTSGTPSKTLVSGVLCQYDCSGTQFTQCLIGASLCPDISNCMFEANTPTDNCISFTPVPVPSGVSLSATPSVGGSSVSGFFCQYLCENSFVVTECLIGASSCPSMTNCNVIDSFGTSNCGTPTPRSTITSTPNPISVNCEYQCPDDSIFTQCFSNTVSCPSILSGCSRISTPMPTTCPSQSITTTPSRTLSPTSTQTPSIEGQSCNYNCIQPSGPNKNVVICTPGSTTVCTDFTDIGCSLNSYAHINSQCPPNISGFMCEYICYGIETLLVPCMANQYTCSPTYDDDSCLWSGVTFLVPTC